MGKSYQGVETIHIEPEDFDEVNIFNINQEWLEDLKAEFNFENMPDLDLRIFILIDQIEKMATSDGIWFRILINLFMIRPLTRLRMMIWLVVRRNT